MSSGLGGKALKVFVSYFSADAVSVEALARALRERGIDAWFDKWEITGGDDVVAKMDEGLAGSDAGLVVFSKGTLASKWVREELTTLVYRRVEDGKALIPVMVEPDAPVPELMRKLARRAITDLDGIEAALRKRSAKPALGLGQAGAMETRVVVRLGRGAPASVAGTAVAGTAQGGGQISVAVTIDGRGLDGATATYDVLPADVRRGRAAFLGGRPLSAARNPAAAAASVAVREADLTALGRALGRMCLPGPSAAELGRRIEACGVGARVEVVVESSDAELVGLPFEALCLPDGERALAVDQRVTLWRRLLGVAAAPASLPGPLKILVAVGAPDERPGGAPVLDLERELGNILDAVETARRLENCDVRILEVGHPDEIARAFAHDGYHVLHLSCHGSPGKLELEDQDGKAVEVSPGDLLEPLKRANKAVPLVFLSACHGGTVGETQTASFAQALLAAGVGHVVAMQAAVSDAYASKLALAFYRHLAEAEVPLPSRALAAAREALERERTKAKASGASAWELEPEYATAALYAAGGDETPLADYGLEKDPLRERPVYEVAGPVPQLGVDDLIGRRREMREARRVLLDPKAGYAGVVLTGIGGAGKSAVAGRLMRRLQELGYATPAHVGKWDLGGIASAVGMGLLLRLPDHETGPRRKRALFLARKDTPDELRLNLLAAAMAEEPVVLVLDDFEQNLVAGGAGGDAAFADPDVADFLRGLTKSARAGRVLITSRYPLPGFDDDLREIALPALSAAETRKLVKRLPGLRDRADADIATVLRRIGGHPRLLEFLNALLGAAGAAASGRLARIRARLETAADAANVALDDRIDDLAEGIRRAILLGTRDVFVDELLAIARRNGDEEPLLQLAVSNLPVSPEGLARMLQAPPSAALEAALARLAALSLIVRLGDGQAWVHRWTAESLASHASADDQRARHRRAGEYRWWRAQNETHDLDDGVEAVRNLLAAADFDAAGGIARACLAALTQQRQTVAVVALATEVLSSLPPTYASFAPIADAEARAHLALGFTDRALARYRDLAALHERRCLAEPGRADYQRDVSVSYNKLGELYVALGEGDKAREYFVKDLEIAERLATAEPWRADYQRDMSISYERLGNLYRDLGEGEKAREYFVKPMEIRERLAAAEPGRADYQRDLSVSYNKLGDLYRDLGEREKGREYFVKAMEIRQRLAVAEPGRADYQRDVSVSYERLGSLYRDLGEMERAREYFVKAMEIQQGLAAVEPGRADYQRDLSVSYCNLGDVHVALGEGEKAREYFVKTMEILQRLAAAEPGRADYQRDLSVSYNRLGDLYQALGEGEKALAYFVKDMEIAERLAAAEPGRADHQIDLAISYAKTGDTRAALEILRRLKAEGRLPPNRFGLLDSLERGIS